MMLLLDVFHLGLGFDHIDPPLLAFDVVCIVSWIICVNGSTTSILLAGLEEGHDGSLGISVEFYDTLKLVGYIFNAKTCPILTSS